MRKKIEIGRVYNSIIIVEKIVKGKWKCKCKCGNFLEVSSSNLPNTKTCGCSKRKQNEIYLEKRKMQFLKKIKVIKTCWEWQGFINKLGYGTTSLRSKFILAHRLAWILFKEEIPKEIHVCHTCDNPLCVNPDHLFLGTHQDNMNDMFMKNRKSHKGENHPRSKLCEKDINEIFKLRKNGWTQTKIAELFGVYQTVISRILNKKLWSHIKG
jgi:hypothetical protein